MPRGVRKVLNPGEGAATPLDALHAQSTAQDDAKPVVRSRDEEEAERYAAEFLKNNRGSLTGFEKRLPEVPDRPGWVRRWVNDVNSNVGSRMQAGWKLVAEGSVPSLTSSIARGNTDVGGGVSIVSSLGDGPMRVVLMEIPKQLYDMQVEAAMEPIRRTEAAIREGRNHIDDSQHVYTPRGITNRIETPQ